MRNTATHRYQVKFQWEGQTRYGIVESFSDEAEAAAKKGLLIIEDAIKPERFKVKDDITVVDIPMNLGCYDHAKHEWGEGTDEYNLHVHRAFKKAQEESDALPPGLVSGKLFSTTVGDGRAWYLVTKVNKRTVRIEWRGFGLDRYVDAHFGYGGSMPRDMVERFVKLREFWRRQNENQELVA